MDEDRKFDRVATKVLFIDDNKRVVQTVKSLLGKVDYQFISAPNGLDGLFALVADKPEIVFIGAGAAKLDGFQFCVLVKSKIEYREIPVIIVLEKDDCFEQSRALAAGAAAVLTKPFGTSDFFGLISGVFRRAAQTRSLT